MCAHWAKKHCSVHCLALPGFLISKKWNIDVRFNLGVMCVRCSTDRWCFVKIHNFLKEEGLEERRKNSHTDHKAFVNTMQSSSKLSMSGWKTSVVNSQTIPPTPLNCPSDPLKRARGSSQEGLVEPKPAKGASLSTTLTKFNQIFVVRIWFFSS